METLKRSSATITHILRPFSTDTIKMTFAASKAIFFRHIGFANLNPTTVWLLLGMPINCTSIGTTAGFSPLVQMKKVENMVAKHSNMALNWISILSLSLWVTATTRMNELSTAKITGVEMNACEPVLLLRVTTWQTSVRPAAIASSRPSQNRAMTYVRRVGTNSGLPPPPPSLILETGGSEQTMRPICTITTNEGLEDYQGTQMVKALTSKIFLF